MKVQLTDEQMRELARGARQDVAVSLINEWRDELELLSPSQVCGILDVNSKTLATLDIPKVTVIPGKVHRYRASVVAAWIKANEK